LAPFVTITTWKWLDDPSTYCTYYIYLLWVVQCLWLLIWQQGSHFGAFQEHTNCSSTLLVMLLLFHCTFSTYLHHDSWDYIYIIAIYCNLIPVPVMRSNYRNFIWTTDGNNLNVNDVAVFLCYLGRTLTSLMQHIFFASHFDP